MDIINEMVYNQQYKIETISYRDDLNDLTKFNGEKLIEIRIKPCINYFYNIIDNRKLEKHLLHWHRDSHDPVKLIIRKVGDKHIATFHDYAIMFKLIFTELDSFSAQYHKTFNPDKI